MPRAESRLRLPLALALQHSLSAALLARKRLDGRALCSQPGAAAPVAPRSHVRIQRCLPDGGIVIIKSTQIGLISNGIAKTSKNNLHRVVLFIKTSCQNSWAKNTAKHQRALIVLCAASSVTHRAVAIIGAACAEGACRGSAWLHCSPRCFFARDGGRYPTFTFESCVV